MLLLGSGNASGGDALAAYDQLAAKLKTAPVPFNFPLPSGRFIKRSFTAHLCDRYPAPKSAPAKPTDLKGKIVIVPSQPPRSWFFRLTEGPRARRAVAPA